MYSIFMHGGSRMTIDPLMPAMPAMSMSGSHFVSGIALSRDSNGGSAM